MKARGMIPPMVTPVDDNEEIDVEKLKVLTDGLVREGVHGLFPVGSTGEFPSLTRAQRTTVIEAVVERADDRPVLAGCGGTSVREVQQYLADAADAGANAGVIVTPYYMETSQEGLCQFYERLADESPLPIYLYNIPQLTGRRLTVTSACRLADHPMITGIKDSSGDFAYFVELLEALPESFGVLQGLPIFGIPSLDHGADGIVGGPANVFPGPLAEFYDAYHQGNRAQAQWLLRTVIAPITRSIRSIPSPVAFKYLLAKAGLDVGEPIAPLTPLTDEHQQRLDKCYQQIRQVESISI